MSLSLIKRPVISGQIAQRSPGEMPLTLPCRLQRLAKLLRPCNRPIALLRKLAPAALALSQHGGCYDAMDAHRHVFRDVQLRRRLSMCVWQRAERRLLQRDRGMAYQSRRVWWSCARWVECRPPGGCDR